MTDTYYAIVCPPVVPGADGRTVATVCLSGEFDVGARDDLHAAVHGVVSGGLAAFVVVDLSAVTFIDAVSVGELFGGYVAAGRRSIGFRVTGAQGVVRRVLDVLDPAGLLQPS
ncbi:STAS domain-containing protein [Actinoplanes sp. NPDC049596]|uniref:STAS domain-containing protein n=1 Tax=unclassified Actinoplanes TaxID=2626549 RepID=UPI003441FD07